MNKSILRIAPPYNEKTLSVIQSGFARYLGHEVSFTVQEDPALVGGFCAYIDGIVYDNSLATQLKRARRQLSE